MYSIWNVLFDLSFKAMCCVDRTRDLGAADEFYIAYQKASSVGSCKKFVLLSVEDGVATVLRPECAERLVDVR